jgi:pSer/pThr/pTyr-binding forkhead associated (FHA) protein
MLAQDDKVLREISLVEGCLRIGRSPDNGLVIDRPNKQRTCRRFVVGRAPLVDVF